MTMIDGFPLAQMVVPESHESSKPSSKCARRGLKKGFFPCVPAVRGEAERGEPRCGDRGVRLGLHSAHRHPGQYAEQRPCSPLWKTQRWGPDHVHQRHQPGGAATSHLSGHHQGAEYIRHLQLLCSHPEYRVHPVFT